MCAFLFSENGTMTPKLVGSANAPKVGVSNTHEVLLEVEIFQCLCTQTKAMFHTRYFDACNATPKTTPSVIETTPLDSERDIAQLLERLAMSPKVLGSTSSAVTKLYRWLDVRKGIRSEKLYRSLNKILCNRDNVLPVHMHEKYYVKM
jgi:hypothetical protein